MNSCVPSVSITNKGRDAFFTCTCGGKGAGGAEAIMLSVLAHKLGIEVTVLSS